MSSAVLVHGAWSSPADWDWVVQSLDARGIRTSAPDLPSHRHRSADRSDDVREVQAAISALRPPIVVVGWSYGGAVVSDLPDTHSIGALLYLGYVPGPADPSAAEGEPFDPTQVPWLLADDLTVVLDNEWWLNTDSVRGWPRKVVTHLRNHPRRPITRSAWLAPPKAEAWREVPTTLVIGRSDQFVSPAEQAKASEQFEDVRLVEGGHFLPFLQPELISDTIAELTAVK